MFFLHWGKSHAKRSKKLVSSFSPLIYISKLFNLPTLALCWLTCQSQYLFSDLNTCTTRPLSFVLGIKSPTPCESEHLQPSASICGLGTVRHCVDRSLFHHLLSSHSTLHPIPHSTVYTGPVTGEESTIRLK